MERQRDASPCGENGSEMRSHVVEERSPKLRASCDSCTRSKLRCDQNKPSCGRCTDRDDICNYSRMGRVGRPPRLSLSNRPVPPPSQSAVHRQAAIRNKKTARPPTSHELCASPDAEQASDSRYEERETEKQVGSRFGRKALDRHSTRDGMVDYNADNTDNDCISVCAGSSPTHRPVVSHNDGRDEPSWLDHATKPAIQSKSDTSPVRSTNLYPEVSDEAFVQESDLNTSSFVQESDLNTSSFDHISASKPTPTGSTSLQDSSSNTIDLELGSFMDADFDFDVDVDVDVDMMMHLDTSAEHQLPILPPTSQVEAPTEPPSTIVGQLEDAWNRLQSGTSELQSIIGAVVPARSCSSSSGNYCSCPSLIGRLQLFASHSRLAPYACITKDRAADRRSHSRLPLDLLLFLDEVVYQTISTVLSCGVCSRESRVRLTLYLHVDWLADVLRGTLETDLLRSSSYKGLEGVKTTQLSAPLSGTARLDKDETLASKTGIRKQGNLGDEGVENSWEHETNRLQLGSFSLEGELWQICIRELLKTRLNRLSRTVERIRGSKDRGDHHDGVGCVRSGAGSSSLDRVLVSMTADVYSKIEFLFGMMELWEA